MKKIISVLSAAALAASLAACSPANPGTRTNNVGAPRTGVGTTGTNTHGTTTGTTGYGTRTTGYGTGTTGYGTGTTGYYGTTGYGYGTGYRTGTTTGYGTGTPGYGTNTYGTAAGRYDTDTRGNILSGTPGRYGTYDTRNNMFTNQGFTNAGTTTNGYSIYKAQTGGTNIAANLTGTTSKPIIGFTRVGNTAGKTNNRTTTQSTGTSVQGMSTTAAQNVYVDRQQLANAIASVASNIPGCNGVTVLTGDNQAFVGCNTAGASPAASRSCLQKVHMAAENICPRYYKVYSTNDVNKSNLIAQNANTFSNATDAQFEKMIGFTTRPQDFLCTKSATNQPSSSR